MENEKHLKNVGPIRHNEPPHDHSPDVDSGTVARRLRIDVHDNANDDNDKFTTITRDRENRYGLVEWAQLFRLNYQTSTLEPLSLRAYTTSNKTIQGRVQ